VEWTKVRPSHWVDLKQVSRAAIGAVVVSEDWAFYQHPGYDLEQIKKVLEDDLSLSRGVEGLSRGASTITQQMVKNVFLSRERTLVRKVKELILAVEVERRLGKAKILEVYLNIAEWGEGIYGIREAAQFYFHKSPKELSAKEGAFLAMLLPSPKRYSQSFRAKKLTHYARKTTQDILSKMRQAKWITDEIHAAESARPLAFEVADAPDSKEESEEASPTVEDPSVPLAPEELFEVPHDSPSE
jgi:monofunctional biosynthetic peptidoglycan transglycosylase